ncbi:death ligand signal enhancer [Gouania willdenowi]|uniref:Death ligand signal enhancer n=1 Tax=Gouania willdenowi TaxID=441366 RepID=A0A8C5DNV9_GOUWI|nr:death ligand signal enhancer [Gouania willdenowi]
MWRVQGLFGRVLHRCPGSSTLRLPQSHHVEDEVINSTALLSSAQRSSDSSSQQQQQQEDEEEGERKRKNRTFQSSYSELPHYTALDAVGWGAVTVLFMQMCRRVHSQLSTRPDPSPTPGALTAPSTLQKCGYNILLEILSRRDVLPRRSVYCLQAAPEIQSRPQTPPTNGSSADSHHSSSEQEQLRSTFDQQRALFAQDLFIPEESSLSTPCSQQEEANQENASSSKLPDEEFLAAAALNLRHVGETSVPVVLNIIGVENSKSGSYKEAFTCFLAAAQQGYNKAQFNTAVCYEKGRGVGRDREKALYYYQLAADGGHKQAQYCYAKLILTSRGQHSSEELETAITLLKQAAAAGLTKAQVCLASVYSREPLKYGYKFIEYLEMAAESGDDTALFLLGDCYNSGFGVQQNVSTAVEFFKRAAQAGNMQAKMMLTPPKDIYGKVHGATLRTTHSAPCFSAVHSQIRHPLSPMAGVTVASTPQAAALPLLTHSCSTGSLCLPLSSTPLHLLTPSTQTGSCQWTVGVG